jgi:lactoylglutathione lyase
VIAWQASVEVLTFYVDNLPVSKLFYHDQFGLSVEYEDEESVVLDCGDLSINLVASPTKRESAGERIPPRVSAPRFKVTLDVEDVDATCAELSSRGVLLLSEPTDRAGGFRNATFIDPDGYVWEVVQQLPQTRTVRRAAVESVVVPPPKAPPSHALLVASS